MPKRKKLDQALLLEMMQALAETRETLGSRKGRLALFLRDDLNLTLQRAGFDLYRRLKKRGGRRTDKVRAMLFGAAESAIRFDWKTVLVLTQSLGIITDNVNPDQPPSDRLSPWFAEE